MKRVYGVLLLLSLFLGLFSGCAAPSASTDSGTDTVLSASSQTGAGSGPEDDFVSETDAKPATDSDGAFSDSSTELPTDAGPLSTQGASTEPTDSVGKDSEASEKTPVSSPASTETGSEDADTDRGTESDTDTDGTTPSDSSGGTQSSLTASEVLSASEHLVGVCDQKNGRIVVYDLSVETLTGSGAVVWEYKDAFCSGAAGVKLRYSEQFGELVVLICGRKGVSILSYATKKELFHAVNGGENPHSVELLPSGHLIVASSSDHSVYVFPKSVVASGSGIYSHRAEVRLAHGVLWDPKYQILWAAGDDRLTSFTVGGTEDAPALIQKDSYKTPQYSVHDLSPCYGDPDALFVTCAAGIVKFNKKTGAFGYDYPGGGIGKSHPYVSGMGNYHDNVLVFTSVKEDTQVENDYSTNVIFIYLPNVGKYGTVLRRNGGGVAFYKARVWCPDYQ